MFEYKTRTETINGCKFVEQDILLFDYIYSGDIAVEFEVDYMSPGFGIVIAENIIGDISESDNMYLVKFGKDNEYQIITKQKDRQITLKNEFILGGATIKVGTEKLRLSMKFMDGHRLIISKLFGKEDGTNDEIKIVDFDFPYELEQFKLGFYSNSGNTLKSANIESESPSNWVSNVYNGNGGRINWVKNGFQIEDCEYDCEVEAQNVELKEGTYYFDFICDNPDMKYYIYPSEMRDTGIKRTMDEILATKNDEKKNILDYKNKSFKVNHDGTINIKFKGKHGTVKNITVKKNKNDKFVETDYDTIKRDGSWMSFNLDKCKKVELEIHVTGLPEEQLGQRLRYFLFEIDGVALTFRDIDNIKLDETFKCEFNTIDRGLKVNGKLYENLKNTADSWLTILKNVDAEITKMIITPYEGDPIDSIVQTNSKILLNKDISTPIIVTDLAGNPFDLSSSYREEVIDERRCDVFNKFVPIRLSRTILINNPNIKIAGVNSSSIDKYGETLEEAIDGEYKLISPNNYSVNYELNSIKVDPKIREKYKNLVVEYSHCDNFRYRFTNYEREIYDLQEEYNIYLEKDYCDVPGSVLVYGIPKGATLLKFLLHRIPKGIIDTSIDLCVDKYEIIPANKYTINNANKITFFDEIRDKYDYLIVDYLKADSYSINKTEKFYEVSIATTEERAKVLYDSTENFTVNTYKKLDLTDMVNDNFIVLRKN